MICGPFACCGSVTLPLKARKDVMPKVQGLTNSTDGLAIPRILTNTYNTDSYENLSKIDILYTSRTW